MLGSLSNSPRNFARSGLRPQVQDLRTENIAALAARAGQLEGVIPLWYGEGDVATPDFIREGAKTALDRGMTFYIPDMRGTAGLTEALAGYQSELHGRPISVERSTVTPGGMQAVLLAMELIVDVGTNVVFIEPQWPNLASAIHLVGGEPRPVPLRFDTDFRLDLDRVFAACDARTRAIAFSSPANPTGWTATKEQLEALVDFSRRTGIWIVSDEVYNRLYFPARSAPSILSVCDEEDRVMSINSFSKAWAMTGWRVGWLTHPPSIRDEVAAMTQYTNSGTAGFVQAGAEIAIRSGEELVGNLRERVRQGLDLAYDRLSNVPGIVLPEKPVGGMYAFFGLAGIDDSVELCTRILDEARVGLAPGYLFGESGRSFVRMCVFRDRQQISTALDRIETAFGSAARRS